MTDREYVVIPIVLDGFDDLEESLAKALSDSGAPDLDLVACFPKPGHFSGELHQVPFASEGTKPYDDVWTAPTGPVFVAVFRRVSR